MLQTLAYGLLALTLIQMTLIVLNSPNSWIHDQQEGPLAFFFVCLLGASGTGGACLASSERGWYASLLERAKFIGADDPTPEPAGWLRLLKFGGLGVISVLVMLVVGAAGRLSAIEIKANPQVVALITQIFVVCIAAFGRYITRKDKEVALLSTARESGTLLHLASQVNDADASSVVNAAQSDQNEIGDKTDRLSKRPVSSPMPRRSIQ